MMLKSEVISLLFLLFTHQIVQNTLGFSLNNGVSQNPNNGATSSEPTTGKTTTTKELTASQRERRDEESRRASRQNTAKPGLTSAIPGATDFPLTPAKTEVDLSLSSSSSENQIRHHTDRGMEALRMLKIEEAHVEFQKLYSLNPDAYCWQAGVVMFYLGMEREGCECFVGNARVWEGRFGEPASEERIWRDVCELKLRSMVDVAGDDTDRKSSSASIPRFGSQIEDQDPNLKETRKVLRFARDLFSASIEGDLIKVTLARAKLRSICGNVGRNDNSSMSRIRRQDAKMWALSSWFYLGLHYDATGDIKQSKICMKMALHQTGSFGNGKDVIQALPMLHMSRRDWYDDDDFEEEESMADATCGQVDYFSGKEQEDEVGDDGTSSKRKNQSSMEYLAESIDAGNNPDITEMRSIMDSLDKMKLVKLKDCARNRGMKATGSKGALSRRLLRSLIQQGF